MGAAPWHEHMGGRADGRTGGGRDEMTACAARQVVMQKGAIELDMRDRCSAGQKVRVARMKA